MTDTITLTDIYTLLEKVAVKVGVDLEPPPAPPGGLKLPSGPIQTRGPKGQALGSWDTISRWSPRWENAVREAGDSYGALLLACFAVIESGGKHYRTGEMTGTRGDVLLGGGDPPSVGILQVVCGYHAGVLPDADCYTPDGNIRIGAQLLAGWIRSEGSWEAALERKWHPGTDPGSGYTPRTYIETVRKLIAEAKGEQPPTGRANPFRTPAIYNLATDYARFGLNGAEAQRILANHFPNRNGGQPFYIVNHIQDGTTPGSLDWWANGAGVQASSTVMAQKDGSLLRIIPEQHGPFTNGDVCNPTAKSAGLRAKGGNPNNWCLTLEAEGRPGISAVSYTPEQEESICWQYADWIIRYELGTAADVVLSHASINTCSRLNCPGEQNQLRILKRLKDAGF